MSETAVKELSPKLDGVLKTVEGLTDDRFKGRDFGVRQFLEFIIPPFVGQSPFVLPNEQKNAFCEPVRHFNEVHNAAQRLIATAEIIDFAGQIALDRSRDARVEKLRRFRGVKITV